MPDAAGNVDATSYTPPSDRNLKQDFVAVQGLNQKLENQMREKDSRIAALEQTVDELKAFLTDLIQLKESAP